MFVIWSRLAVADKVPAKMKLFLELSFKEQIAVATDNLTIILLLMLVSARFINLSFISYTAEANSEPSQTSRIEPFMKMIKS